MNNSDAKPNAEKWQLTAITEALGELTLPIEDTLTIGRGQDNDVVLGSQQVSRQHAQLAVVNDQLTLEDLGSSNGTLVNDKKVQAHHSEILADNDVITFAAFSFKVNKVANAPNAVPVTDIHDAHNDPQVAETQEAQRPVDAQDIEQPAQQSASEPVQSEPAYKEALTKKTTSASEATEQARTNTKAVEDANIDDMNKAELEQKLEQELEEPIAYGDPKQEGSDKAEYYDELAAEADPEVHRSKQSASAQMSATTEIHEEIAESAEIPNSSTKRPASQSVSQSSSITDMSGNNAANNAAVTKEGPVTTDPLQKTKVAEPKPTETKPTETFNTVNESKPHDVAHIKNSTPASQPPKKSGSNTTLWIVLILIALAAALWLFNS